MGDGIAIRRYEPGDWERLCAIHDRARVVELRGSVDPAAFLTLEQTANGEGLFDGEVLVAEAGGAVAGFVAVSADEVTWLYVDPDRARRGIGRALLRHALTRCGPVATTTVLAGNAPALALYQAEGFVIAETTRGRLAGNEAFAATGHLLRRGGGR